MNEKELVKGCIRGNRVCQKLFYDTFSAVMYAICLRYGGNAQAASDMMQEGFITVFRKLHLFEFKGSLEGWVKRIMIHTCINQLRNKNKQMLSFDDLSSSDEVQASAEPSVFARLSVTDVLKAMNQLTPGQRTILSLYAIDGFEHHEIAQMLRINESTSRGNLAKARKALLNKLKSLMNITVL